MTVPELTDEERRMCSDALRYRKPGEQEVPSPVFATVTGAHLYGWADERSDYDVRGIHVADARELLGVLRVTQDTVDRDVAMEPCTVAEIYGPPDQPAVMPERATVDIVTHEIGKFVRLLCKPNGNFLEMLHSPLVVEVSVDIGHERIKELRELSKDLMCKRLAEHYLGFYQGQRKRYSNLPEKYLRQVLYGYRVLLSGIVAMKQGVIEAHLPELLRKMELTCAAWHLMDRKIEGGFICPAPLAATALEEQDMLCDMLEQARKDSALPDEPRLDRINQWLIDYRLDRQEMLDAQSAALQE